jgi:4'-phosphopantetheinyl transferase
METGETLSLAGLIEDPPAGVELRCVDLDAWHGDGTHLQRDLSVDERDRALGFRFERDRRRFVLRRALLREFLAQQLDCAPGEVRLSYSRFGKPYLARSDLHFNLSHSRGMALYVMARGYEVGCDIERCDDGLASEAVAARFFSTLELKRLHALPKEAWLEGFFDCWTRKEALLKASGYGLSPPLGAVEAPPYAAAWRPERWRL